MISQLFLAVLFVSGSLCLSVPYQPIDSICGPYEEYKSCGTACPLTCKTMNDPPMCIAVCRSGCFCKDGYVRSDITGMCVPIKECGLLPDTRCGLHQEFNTCGTACPLTCNNYQSAPLACVKMCKIGCFCEKGYVWSDVHGRCVEPVECGLI